MKRMGFLEWVLLILPRWVLLILLMAGSVIYYIGTKEEGRVIPPSAGKSFPVATPIAKSPPAQEKEQEVLLKVASNVVYPFWEQFKKGEDVRDYLASDLINLKKIFGPWEKIKITEAEFGGDSLMAVKVCDKEGLCEGFSFHLTFVENRWQIYQIQKFRTIREIEEGERRTTTPLPSQIVKDLFDLIKKKKYAETQNLFAKREGTSTIGLEGVLTALKGIEIEGVEIVDEATKEIIRCKIKLWNVGGDSADGNIGLLKGKDGKWKIRGCYVLGYPC